MATMTAYGDAARQLGIPVSDVLRLVDEGRVDATMGPHQGSRTILVDLSQLEQVAADLDLRDTARVEPVMPRSRIDAGPRPAGFVRTREAVEATGIELREVYRLVHEGEVAARRHGDEVLVELEQLQAVVNQAG